MALSATRTSHDVAGAKIFQTWDLAFTSVTGGAVVTGLTHVLFASYSPSTTEDHGIVYKNSASASEVEDDPGQVYINGVTSSDNGQLFVIGY